MLKAPRGLIFDEGETWKANRHVLSPTFSASKMKMVSIYSPSRSLIFPRLIICNVTLSTFGVDGATC